MKKKLLEIFEQQLNHTETLFFEQETDMPEKVSINGQSFMIRADIR
ncbi:MAG: hypothetical protein Q8O88_03835 [bacterium]|nr:hypothetical protein [bacterium]